MRDIGLREYDAPGLHLTRVVVSRSILDMCYHGLLILGVAYYQIAQFNGGEGALVDVARCHVLKRRQGTIDAEEKTKTTLAKAFGLVQTC